jgi:hypothetical protein
MIIKLFPGKKKTELGKKNLAGKKRSRRKNKSTDQVN